MKQYLKYLTTLFSSLLVLVLTTTAASALELSDLVGTWNMSYDMGQGPASGTITVSQESDGSARIVLATSAGGNSEATNISIADDTLSFSRDVNAQGQSLSVSYTAELVDGKLQGEFELSIGGGPIPWTAEKAN